MYVNVEHSNWDEFLQPSISAYNTTVHSSLKLSPYEALFAKPPTILAEVMLAAEMYNRLLFGRLGLRLGLIF